MQMRALALLACLSVAAAGSTQMVALRHRFASKKAALLQPMAGGKPAGEGAYQDPKVVEAATHSKATKCEDNKHTGIECYESGGDYLDGHRMHIPKSAGTYFRPPWSCDCNRSCRGVPRLRLQGTGKRIGDGK